ncbi:MAG: hypothetical protein HOI29_07155, partial [Planctomycetes bacterium]|nr:hypothetical protein [Planctomycetota bacterium]
MKHISMLLILLLLTTICAAQESETQEPNRSSGEKRAYFWIRMWPDFLVQ